MEAHENAPMRPCICQYGVNGANAGNYLPEEAERYWQIFPPRQPKRWCRWLRCRERATPDIGKGSARLVGAKGRYFFPFGSVNGGMSIGRPTRMKNRAKD
jgi:hypothetical protein